jgi:flagellar hook-associated protein 2
MATTVSATSGTAPVTTQGVGSGLDIASIVDKLVAVESQPLTNLQTQEAAYQTKLSAYASARGVLSTFQSAVGNLTDPKAFASYATSVDDTSVASATVDATNPQPLTAGVHTLRVDTLAASQRVATTGVADTTSAVGTGTITIDIGSWDSTYSTFTPNGTVGSKTITIDSTNNSLAGIRDAINNAGSGVTASIINDGSGNRLVLSSNATGAANGFRISTVDSDGNNLDAAGLSKLAFDPSAAGGTPQTSHVADGTDAKFSIDGIAITKPGNHVTDAIAGLALDLKTADSTTTTTFTISRDTSTVKSNINAFVSAYNTLVSNIGTLTAYDATSNTAAALNGDSSIRLISTRLQAMMATVLPGSGNMQSLNDLGIKFSNTGALTVDDAKLTSALTTNPDAVSKLFVKTATSNDSLVTYKTSTNKTVVGNYALNVSQLATRGTLTGSAAANLTIATGVNDTIGITVDNVPVTITIPAGTYASASALATQVQAQINGQSALSNAGSSVTVAATNGVLSFTSQRYGSASSVVVNDGNGASDLVGTASTTTGLDVAGTLNGVSFIGAGQTATGAANTSMDGLQLTISGGTTGDRGTIAFTSGIASQVNDTLTTFLDTTNGLLQAATDGVNASIKDVQNQETSWTARIADIRARITAQYNAMDALVASLNSTSSFLTQQLDAIAKSTSSSSSK